MLTAAAREEMLMLISDLSKDACGFRVRKDYGAMSDDELEADWNYFIELAEETAASERRAQEQAVANWRKEISDIAEQHGVDQATAIRWHIQSMGHEGDDFDFYMWSCGIGYTESLKIAQEFGYGRMAA